MTGDQASIAARFGATMLRVRWFARAPILLYRARLGFLFGRRFLLLEHRGRNSGARRYAMLEVIDHPDPECRIVVSGFGERAQWFRNVMAEPSVRIYIAGHQPRRATARRLDPAAASTALTRYADARPRAWAKLRPVLEQTLGARLPPDGVPTELPLVAFDTALNS